MSVSHSVRFVIRKSQYNHSTGNKGGHKRGLNAISAECLLIHFVECTLNVMLAFSE